MLFGAILTPKVKSDYVYFPLFKGVSLLDRMLKKADQIFANNTSPIAYKGSEHEMKTLVDETIDDITYDPARLTSFDHVLSLLNS